MTQRTEPYILINRRNVMKKFELKKTADISAAENRKAAAELLKTAYEAEQKAVKLM